MSFLLLTAAGFSKNWGGLVASEFFSRLLLVKMDGDIRAQLINTKSFETVMATLQATHAAHNTEATKTRLAQFESAVLGIFNGMNGDMARRHFEFQNDIAFTFSKFLQRFDAIYTLNQDGLLEMHYMPGVITGGRWDGVELPGMQHFGPQPIVHSFTPRDRLDVRSPVDGNFRTHVRLQPYFKLHGSANWRTDATSGPLLILGGKKSAALALHPILTAYLNDFQTRLKQPGARLMIIGYGFNDEHINDAIAEGVKHGLKLFIVDIRGMDAYDKNDHTAAIPGPSDPFTELLNSALMTESRHPLTYTFGPDGNGEHRHLSSFFKT